MGLEHLTAYAIGQMVNSKQISPVEVIDYFAKRIKSKNKSLNAFVYTKIDDARYEAQKLEKRIMNGEYIGLFAGVPFGLKDFLPSKEGWTNTHGGVYHLTATDDSSSEFCKAAERLGGIAIGKTNAPAFGFSGLCSNQMYGATKNPFNVYYNSGGSSGGTASAVGGGLIPIGEGGDAGGSIRIPAAWCNCFGLKPSLGTVPSYCRPDGWAATHPYCFNGAITRSVMDSAVMLTEMARYNPRDPISLPINSSKKFVDLMKKPIKDWRIGFTPDFELFTVDPEIKDIVRTAALRFEEAGARVEPVYFHFRHSLEEIARCWCWSISVDTKLDLEMWKADKLDLVKDYSDELTPEFVVWNGIAGRVGIQDMREFNEIRTDILDAFEDVFEHYDIIISPTTCCKPFKNNEKRPYKINDTTLPLDIDFISFAQTFLINFVGYPAASVPCGYTSDGLPVGMQVIGKQFRDEDVLAMSYTFENIQPWNYNKVVIDR